MALSGWGRPDRGAVGGCAAVVGAALELLAGVVDPVVVGAAFLPPLPPRGHQKGREA